MRLLIFVLPCLLSAAAQALMLSPLWTTDLHMTMEASPVAVDLDGDGDLEIVTAAYENLIAVDGSGVELWRFDTRGRYQTKVAVLQRDGASPLLYAADQAGLLSCLDAQGQPVWQQEIGGVFAASAALADLDGDGDLELLQGDKKGMLHAFDALTGTPVWQTQVEGECSTPAVHNAGDGAPEVAIATTMGKLYLLSAVGEIQAGWPVSLGDATPDWATSSPVFVGEGEASRILCGSKNRLICLDPKGEILWEQQTRGDIGATLSTADFDGDGQTDIFAITQLGVVYRFTADGRQLWDLDMQGRCLAPGTVVDLDEDGKLEFLLSTQTGSLLTLGQQLELVYHHQFDNRIINTTPAVGDFDKVRPGLEVAITGGESGRLICYGVEQGASATLADSGTQSAPATMTPQDLEAEKMIVNTPIRFAVEMDAVAALGAMAEVRCMRPDGSRQHAIAPLLGHSGMVQLPLQLTGRGNYQFEWAVRDAQGMRLGAGARSLEIQPNQNELNLAKIAIEGLKSAVTAQAPGEMRETLAKESADLEIEAAAAGKLLKGDGDLKAGAASAAALATRAKRALTLVEATQTLQENSTQPDVLPFEGTTWENRAVNRQLPAAGNRNLRIERRAVPGEHEPVSIKLWNITSAPIRVVCDVVVGEGGPRVTAYAVKQVPTNQGETAWDPLAPIAVEPLEIPSLETGEIWLDIDLDKVAPGTHTLKVSFGEGCTAPPVDIVIEVLPFTLADAAAMRLCMWAEYNDSATQDLLAHGNNVFIHHLHKPTVESGKVSIDFAELDTFIAPLKDRDIYLLLGGVPDLGVEVESPEYVVLLRQYLDHVFSHLNAHGFPENRIAFYPYDEPATMGWDTVNNYLKFARQAEKARPGVTLYVNGTGDLPQFEALAEVAGLWSPSFYMLPYDSPEMRAIRATNKPLWSYDCFYQFSRPIGYNTKTTNVVAQYRMAAITGFNYGATGIGYWCYNNGNSLWDADPVELPIVYKNADGSTTISRRWEAVREGLEDARILIALRDRLKEPSLPEAARGAIRELLEVTVPSQSRATMDGARLGVARYVLDSVNNDESVATLRKEMMDCVARLR